MKWIRLPIKCLAVGVLASTAATWQLRGQSRQRIIEEPQMFRIRLEQVEAGVYAEGEYETTRFEHGGQTITAERLFVGPLIGLSLDGSIYHPYFLQFRADSEGSYGWNQQTTSGNSKSTAISGLEYLGRFNASADMFSNKPYNIGYSAGYSRTFRDYDFFNRVTVDSWNYGARGTLNLGAVSLNGYYTHTDEQVQDSIFGSSTHQDTAGLGARNERAAGSTDFRYTFSRYSLNDSLNKGSAIDHALSLADSERFGTREQIRLQSGVNYDLREGTPNQSDQVDAYGNLTIEHSTTLSSAYNLSYDRYVSGSAETDSYAAAAQLHHQLFTSLGSTLSVLGQDSEFGAEGSTGYSRRVEAGIAEVYTKHLGPEHTVQLSESLQIGQVQQKSISDVINEKHTFGGSSSGAPPDSFFLNMPNVVLSSVVVMDGARLKIYSPVLDYEVIQNGTRTVISLRPGNSIPPGSSVSVDYRTEPTPAGQYQELSDFAQIRFDLWHGLVGIYGRFGVSMNNAPRVLRVQNLTSYAFGTDLHWRGISAGAEYDLYRSDESEYNSARFFQAYSFHPDAASAAGLNFSETFTRYITADRDEQDYRFMSFYRRSLGRKLNFDCEAGVDFRRGIGVDQTLIAVRPTLNYVIGKTSIGLTYDYEYSVFRNSEQRQKNLFTLRLRRTF